ncbi:MAG TPA: hypothetical protein VGN54_14900 [Mycobacteriales bacterium]|jgi:hypothetical protein|nr:hypothetical protein [Mycobacteriales bacterium]
MASRLRRADGGPAARVQLAALLIVLVLVLATAPLVLDPVLHWLLRLLP